MSPKIKYKKIKYFLEYKMPPKKQYNKKRRNGFKKNFRKQRARRVETKRREHAEIAIRNSTGGAGNTFSAYYPDPTKATSISSSTAMSMMPIRSFYRMSKGTRPNQMIGNEIFSKSLYLKGKITGLPANNTQEAFLYWGWVQDKLGLSDFTTPHVNNATRTDVENFILNQVKQHFDEQGDEMRYREKKKDNIKIVGVRKLQHPQDASYQDSVDFKCSWRTSRKVVYTQGRSIITPGQQEAGNNQNVVDSTTAPHVVDLTDSFKDSSDAKGGDIGVFLPLNSWLPFALIFVPNYSAVSPGTIQIMYNDIHYFTG